MLSSCPNCWESPCVCGHEGYIAIFDKDNNGLDHDSIIKLIKNSWVYDIEFGNYVKLCNIVNDYQNEEIDLHKFFKYIKSLIYPVIRESELDVVIEQPSTLDVITMIERFKHDKDLIADIKWVISIFADNSNSNQNYFKSIINRIENKIVNNDIKTEKKGKSKYGSRIRKR